MSDSTNLHHVAAEDVVGTWDLVSVRRQILESGEIIAPFGSAPTGRLTDGRDGSVIVRLVASGRPRPDSLAAITDAMRVRLHRSMRAYAGSWTMEGSRVRHRIDLSWNEVWSGTDELRHVGTDEVGQLILRTDSNRGIADGTFGVSTFTWRRPAAPKSSQAGNLATEALRVMKQVPGSSRAGVVDGTAADGHPSPRLER